MTRATTSRPDRKVPNPQPLCQSSGQNPYHLARLIRVSLPRPTFSLYSFVGALGAIERSRNFSEIARQVGMSREGLYKALSTDGNPTLATVVKVAHTLGLRLRFEAIA